MAVMPLEEARARIEIPIPLRRVAVGGAQPPSGPSRRVLVLAALIALLAAVAGFVGWQVLLHPVAVEVGSVGTNVPVQVFGLGILVITHDEKIFGGFDRLVRLRDGRMEADGPMQSAGSDQSPFVSHGKQFS